MNDAESHNLFWGEYARLFFFLRKRYAGAARSRYIDKRSRCFPETVSMRKTEGASMRTIRRIQWFIRFVQHAHKETVKVGNRLINNFTGRLTPKPFQYRVRTDTYTDLAEGGLRNSTTCRVLFCRKKTHLEAHCICRKKKKTYSCLGIRNKRANGKIRQTLQSLRGKCTLMPTAKNIITTTKQIIICKRIISFSSIILSRQPGI